MDEGSLVRLPTFSEGRYMKFLNGAFSLCTADGTVLSPITTVPTDQSGWEKYTAPLPTVLAIHVNLESGVAHTSLVGSDKFSQRQANCRLRYLGTILPVSEEVAA